MEEAQVAVLPAAAAEVVEVAAAEDAEADRDQVGLKSYGMVVSDRPFPRIMEPTKEKLVGCALALGGAIALCALPLMLLFGLAGGFRLTATGGGDKGTLDLIPLTITLFLMGLVLMGAAVSYGLLYNRRLASGPRRVIADALVLSRYATDKAGNFLSDFDLEAAENPRFFVRMRTPDGRVGEYPVAGETYFNCAEGMPGEAELQGRWLGRFTPYVGPRPQA